MVLNLNCSETELIECCNFIVWIMYVTFYSVAYTAFQNRLTQRSTRSQSVMGPLISPVVELVLN